MLNKIHDLIKCMPLHLPKKTCHILYWQSIFQKALKLYSTFDYFRFNRADLTKKLWRNSTNYTFFNDFFSVMWCVCYTTT